MKGLEAQKRLMSVIPITTLRSPFVLLAEGKLPRWCTLVGGNLFKLGQNGALQLLYSA